MLPVHMVYDLKDNARSSTKAFFLHSQFVSILYQVRIEVSLYLVYLNVVQLYDKNHIRSER